MEHICVIQTYFSLLMATTCQWWRYNLLSGYIVKGAQLVIWVGELYVNVRELPLESSPTNCIFLGHMFLYICLMGLFCIVIISGMQLLYSDTKFFAHMASVSHGSCGFHLIDVYSAVLIVIKWSPSSLSELCTTCALWVRENSVMASLLDGMEFSFNIQL